MVKKKRVPIIFEDDAIIVCEKPAGYAWYRAIIQEIWMSLPH